MSSNLSTSSSQKQAALRAEIAELKDEVKTRQAKQDELIAREDTRRIEEDRRRIQEDMKFESQYERQGSASDLLSQQRIAELKGQRDQVIAERDKALATMRLHRQNHRVLTEQYLKLLACHLESRASITERLNQIRRKSDQHRKEHEQHRKEYEQLRKGSDELRKQPDQLSKQFDQLCSAIIAEEADMQERHESMEKLRKELLSYESTSKEMGSVPDQGVINKPYQLGSSEPSLGLAHILSAQRPASRPLLSTDTPKDGTPTIPRSQSILEMANFSIKEGKEPVVNASQPISLENKKRPRAPSSRPQSPRRWSRID